MIDWPCSFMLMMLLDYIVKRISINGSILRVNLYSSINLEILMILNNFWVLVVVPQPSSTLTRPPR